ncbi:vitamin K-dependent protein Z-like [Saccoglossus kowalevskii]
MLRNYGNSVPDYIDECASGPCIYGECTDLVNAYTCNCSAGYNGTNCELNINECLSDPCMNGGTCTDGIDKFTCTCTSNWTGLTCNEDVNECENEILNNCDHNCTNHDGGYECQCREGYELEDEGKCCEYDVILILRTPYATCVISQLSTICSRDCS